MSTDTQSPPGDLTVFVCARGHARIVEDFEIGSVRCIHAGCDDAENLMRPVKYELAAVSSGSGEGPNASSEPASLKSEAEISRGEGEGHSEGQNPARNQSQSGVAADTPGDVRGPLDALRDPSSDLLEVAMAVDGAPDGDGTEAILAAVADWLAERFESAGGTLPDDPERPVEIADVDQTDDYRDFVQYANDLEDQRDALKARLAAGGTPTPSHKALVERLRKVADHGDTPDTALLREAANALAGSGSLVDVLVRALEPFAGCRASEGQQPLRPDSYDWPPPRERIKDWFGRSDFEAAKDAVDLARSQSAVSPSVADAEQSEDEIIRAALPVLKAELRPDAWEWSPIGENHLAAWNWAEKLERENYGVSAQRALRIAFAELRDGSVSDTGTEGEDPASERSALLNGIDGLICAYARLAGADADDHEAAVYALRWWEQATGRKHEYHGVILHGDEYDPAAPELPPEPLSDAWLAKRNIKTEGSGSGTGPERVEWEGEGGGALIAEGDVLTVYAPEFENRAIRMEVPEDVRCDLAAMWAPVASSVGDRELQLIAERDAAVKGMGDWREEAQRMASIAADAGAISTVRLPEDATGETALAILADARKDNPAGSDLHERALELDRRVMELEADLREAREAGSAGSVGDERQRLGKALVAMARERDLNERLYEAAMNWFETDAWRRFEGSEEFREIDAEFKAFLAEQKREAAGVPLPAEADVVEAVREALRGVPVGGPNWIDDTARRVANALPAGSLRVADEGLLDRLNELAERVGLLRYEVVSRTVAENDPISRRVADGVHDLRRAILADCESGLRVAGPSHEATYQCSKCGASKGEQALGESCNQNCGGRVVRRQPTMREILADPEAAIRALPEDEQQRHRDARRSVVEARRAAQAGAGDIVLGADLAAEVVKQVESGAREFRLSFGTEGWPSRGWVTPTGLAGHVNVVVPIEGSTPPHATPPEGFGAIGPHVGITVETAALLAALGSGDAGVLAVLRDPPDELKRFVGKRLKAVSEHRLHPDTTPEQAGDSVLVMIADWFSEHPEAVDALPLRVEGPDAGDPDRWVDEFQKSAQGGPTRTQIERALTAYFDGEWPLKEAESILDGLRSSMARALKAAGRVVETPPTDAASMLREFHDAFDAHGDASDPSCRAALGREEAEEAAEAMESGDREAIAKELADVAYVAYGSALVYGIDLDMAIRLVHQSNMSKLGDDGKPLFRDDGKVLKGPNYRPPDMKPSLLDVPPSGGGANDQKETR